MSKLSVLDHGYVRLVEAWGHGIGGRGALDTGDDFECGIIEAARQSTQGSFRGWEEDEKLLKYLFNSKPQHATPFEFAGMIIEVQAPIFVFREWHRHRTQSYNEMSARYAPLPDLNYVPSAERLLINASTTNKQAGKVAGAEELTADTAELVRQMMVGSYDEAERRYQAFLSSGVPKELARVILPVGRYSRMRAQANLRNWLAFMTLRADPGAQWEIRQYAHAVACIIGDVFPHVWDLFLKAQKRDQKTADLSKRVDEAITRLSHELTHGVEGASEIERVVELLRGV